MTREKAIEMLKARLECLERDTSGNVNLCNGDCDSCDFNYGQGNLGEQIEYTALAIDVLSKQRWISVKDKMPEEHDSIFAKSKGTSKWNKNMFEKLSNEVLVTMQYPEGQKVVTTSKTIDGKWNISSIYQQKVTHWMPFPEPAEDEK